MTESKWWDCPECNALINTSGYRPHECPDPDCNAAGDRLTENEVNADQ